MRPQITSQIIGQLIQDETLTDWWKSEAVPIPLFGGQKLQVIFTGLDNDTDRRFIAQADESLRNFFELGIPYRLSISHHIYKNCMDFLNDIGYEEADNHLWKIKRDDEIWDFVHPVEIYISRRSEADEEMYVQLACECDWEQEHGLQLVFRQGKKLTRVSDQDGHLTEADAYNKPDNEDELPSSFNETSRTKENIFMSLWRKIMGHRK